MDTAETNVAMLSAIREAGNFYRVRKYAGAWVPVIVVNGKRRTFTHCSTSGGAMEIAIRQCALASGWSDQ
ncbi:MAG: hypothetical protein AAGA97_09475 [Pseudomonadota bacterium]